MSAIAALAVLLGALAVHHVLPARARAPWLLLLSYAFYAWWAWRFLPLLLLLTAATYFVAKRIAATPPSREARRARRPWLLAGIVFNVAALAAMRFAFRAEPFIEPFAVLGVSFYVLQALAYLFDTYSGVLRTPHALSDFALYLAYFPKIVAGPIERPGAFFRELRAPRPVDDERVARAATLILIGITRKVAIADPILALMPERAFTAPSELGSLALATALLAFAFVVYNDFAGYTAVARGVSALFGIDLSRNFAVPFAARSFGDLWNRWHITFSHWLRDYIYLPLSRALLRRDLRRDNLANLFAPPLVTMLVCGLWHGSSLHMLLWGALHGTFLVIERIVRLRWPARPGATRSAWRELAGIALVFSLSIWSLALLRLPIDQALRFWQQLLTGPLGALPNDRLFLLMIPSLWLDWMQSQHGDDRAFLHWPRPARVALLTATVLFCLAMAGAVAPAAFVYQGF